MTYKWLNEHADDAQEALMLHESDPLFLNVDDPGKDNWVWHPAVSLMLNLHYDYDNGADDQNSINVRAFLQSYKDLMLAAGVTEMADAVYASTGISETDSAGQIHAVFNEMRKRGELTDITFIPESREDDSSEIGLLDDPRLKGHRSFLAAAIPHVRTALCMGMTEGKAKVYTFPGTVFGAYAVLGKRKPAVLDTLPKLTFEICAIQTSRTPGTSSLKSHHPRALWIFSGICENCSSLLICGIWKLLRM